MQARYRAAQRARRAAFNFRSTRFRYFVIKDWRVFKSAQLSPGNHTFKWAWLKDVRDVEGADQVAAPSAATLSQAKRLRCRMLGVFLCVHRRTDAC
jgi:hypothetical protein